MARVAPNGRADERGAVYVEFLIVFFPLFLLFLGICQIALVSAARFVVQHAASSAARSAIVVLESSPDDFGGIDRGWVSRGSASGSPLPERLLQSLGINVPAADRGSALSNALDAVLKGAGRQQQGARMAPIRFAAYVPLAVLAPSPAWLEPQLTEGNLGDALAVSTRARLVEALFYNRAGAAVTLQGGPASDALVTEPIARKAPVTVRVTYLYYCSIPIVRMLACKSLKDLIGELPGDAQVGFARDGSRDLRTNAQRRLASILSLVEDPKQLSRLGGPGARFAVVTGETTLPNQGADYY